MKLAIPLRTVSEANQREHWRARHRRKVAQQKEVEIEWRRLFKQRKVKLPCVVKLIRYGPKKLDSDNLAGSFKNTRDSVARMIGVDDGSELIRFEYDQHAWGRREYAVEIEVVEA